MKYLISLLPLASLAVTFEEFAAEHPDKDLHRARAAYEASIAPPPPAPPTEAELDAAWQASPERAQRVAALTVIAGIKQTLAAIGVQPRTNDQVFADVRTWAMAAQDKGAAAITTLDLITMYGKLEELVGDTAGLIAGTRKVSLVRDTPAVVETEQ